MKDTATMFFDFILSVQTNLQLAVGYLQKIQKTNFLDIELVGEDDFEQVKTQYLDISSSVNELGFAYTALFRSINSWHSKYKDFLSEKSNTIAQRIYAYVSQIGFWEVRAIVHLPNQTVIQYMQVKNSDNQARQIQELRVNNVVDGNTIDEILTAIVVQAKITPVQFIVYKVSKNAEKLNIYEWTDEKYQLIAKIEK